VYDRDISSATPPAISKISSDHSHKLVRNCQSDSSIPSIGSANRKTIGVPSGRLSRTA